VSFNNITSRQKAFQKRDLKLECNTLDIYNRRNAYFFMNISIVSSCQPSSFDFDAPRAFATHDGNSSDSSTKRSRCLGVEKTKKKMETNIFDTFYIQIWYIFRNDGIFLKKKERNVKVEINMNIICYEKRNSVNSRRDHNVYACVEKSAYASSRQMHTLFASSIWFGSNIFLSRGILHVVPLNVFEMSCDDLMSRCDWFLITKT
jgi:hypothetical protein